MLWNRRYSGSGSEDQCASPDLSSAEMTPEPPKRLLQAPLPRQGKITKISSADSLLAMFKSLGNTKAYHCCFRAKMCLYQYINSSEY